MTAKSADLTSALKAAADPQKIETFARFFKTGPGEYGEGDKFLGVTVPAQRAIAKRFYDLDLGQLEWLLRSKLHEQRLTTLIILVYKYSKGDARIRKQIYEFYLRNMAWVNNWDLVDTSAEHIVGDYLRSKDKSILIKLAGSTSIWRRRIAIISTYNYIKQGDPKWTLRIADILIRDQHDLIQKAVGWMLREVGKRIDQKILENFLLEKNRYKMMPRTMLRYAIERLPETRRQAYLAGWL